MIGSLQLAEHLSKQVNQVITLRFTNSAGGLVKRGGRNTGRKYIEARFRHFKMLDPFIISIRHFKNIGLSFEYLKRLRYRPFGCAEVLRDRTRGIAIAVTAGQVVQCLQMYGL